MGNYVLRHAFQESRKMAGNRELPRLFDEIILTAADEDYDAFEHDHKLADLSGLAKRVSVYFNDADRALNVSDLTKGNPERLGSQGPRLPHQLPSKVVVIDVSDVVHGVSEHSYHVDSDEAVKDMTAVLQGQRSERIPSRTFVPHANKYRLDR
jgi:esterase/lipase superfamily enzyme